MSQVSSITDFIHKLKAGVQSPSRYLIEMNLPNGISDAKGLKVYDGSLSNVIKALDTKYNCAFLATAVDLPGFSFDTTVTHSHNTKATTPTGLGDPETCPITFLLDGEGHSYHWIEAASNCVVNTESGTVNYPDEYCFDIAIWLLNKKMNKVIGVRLEMAWIQAVSPISLGYGNTNQAATFIATIHFRKHYPLSNSNGH
jgi:hypothetical protein